MHPTFADQRSPNSNMKGPDPFEPEDDKGISVNDGQFTFNGVNGLGYQDFLQKIRRAAFNEGKSRDNMWMADLAVLHLSGEALTWYETLPEDVQENWNNLKRAIIQKYGEHKTEPAMNQAPPPKAIDKATSGVDPLLPAKIHISNWDTPAFASTVSFPKSEENWLNEGRQRKRKFGGNRGTVYWHLVESSDDVPDNAISAGFEIGVTFYCIRAWYNEGLTLGKVKTQTLFWRAKRAFIIWQGREIIWNGPFEVLVGNQPAVRWIKPRFYGPFKAVEGGFEAQKNKALLVAHFELGRMTQPGKVFSGESHGSYGWWLKECCEGNFHVLAWV